MRWGQPGKLDRLDRSHSSESYQGCSKVDGFFRGKLAVWEPGGRGEGLDL